MKSKALYILLALTILFMPHSVRAQFVRNPNEIAENDALIDLCQFKISKEFRIYTENILRIMTKFDHARISNWKRNTKSDFNLDSPNGKLRRCERLVDFLVRFGVDGALQEIKSIPVMFLNRPMRLSDVSMASQVDLTYIMRDVTCSRGACISRFNKVRKIGDGSDFLIFYYQDGTSSHHQIMQSNGQIPEEKLVLKSHVATPRQFETYLGECTIQQVGNTNCRLSQEALLFLGPPTFEINLKFDNEEIRLTEAMAKSLLSSELLEQQANVHRSLYWAPIIYRRNPIDKP